MIANETILSAYGVTQTVKPGVIVEAKPQYKPHFEWIKFRLSCRQIAMYSQPITQAFQDYIFYLYTQKSEKSYDECQLVMKHVLKEISKG